MVSFLFTDIEGSTRLFRELGDAYRDLLAEHNRLLRDVWADHGGYEVKTEGDSFLVAFESADAALDAAVACQRSLDAADWGAVSVRVRVGLHSGLASPVNDDYIALAVHEAARVVGAAHGGQILATDEVVALRLGESAVAIRPLGRFRLRGFDEAQGLHEVSADGRWPRFPPPRAVPADGHNIVLPLTSFVGRQDDIDGITSQLEEARLVTVVGSAGVGKTRLAMELGVQRSDAFDGGVWFVDWSTSDSVSSLEAEVAHAVGARADALNVIEAVAEHVGAASALLILDSCEHVVRSARGIAESLLRESPKLRLLATSRMPLGLDYERVWHLGPLPTGPGRGGSHELFAERTGSHILDLGEAAAVDEICERLDGVPLAIELAAARARSSSPGTVLSLLEDSARFLDLRRNGSDTRQESLAAVIGWSYELLSPLEREVFSRLAIFAATFSQSTGCSAAADGKLDDLAVSEIIWTLADHSLLERDATASETRYRMLETIRAYADRKLAASERVRSATRLAEAFLSRLAPWQPASEAWIREMRVEAANLRALVSILRDHDPETAQLLAVSIIRHVDFESNYALGSEEAEQFVLDLSAPTPIRPALLSGAALLRRRQGNFDTDDLLADAERILNQLDDVPDWVGVSVGIERVEQLVATGQNEAAIAVASEALQESSSDYGKRAWLQQLGMMLVPDNPTLAVDYLEDGLALASLDWLAQMASLESNLAEALLRLGDDDGAAVHQREALRLGEQLGLPMMVGFSLIVAARLLAKKADWQLAVRLHGAADKIIEESGLALYPDDLELSQQMLREAQDNLGEAYQSVWTSGYDLALADAASEGNHAFDALLASPNK